MTKIKLIGLGDYSILTANTGIEDYSQGRKMMINDDESNVSINKQVTKFYLRAGGFENWKTRVEEITGKKL